MRAGDIVLLLCPANATTCFSASGLMFCATFSGLAAAMLRTRGVLRGRPTTATRFGEQEFARRDFAAVEIERLLIRLRIALWLGLDTV